jgi:hypothetical protein
MVEFTISAGSQRHRSRRVFDEDGNAEFFPQAGGERHVFPMRDILVHELFFSRSESFFC